MAESRAVGLFRKFARAYHRLEVQGEENLPAGAAIIAPNHSGGMDWDVFLISSALERPVHVLYWDKYYHAPVWGDLVRRFGAIPLSLERGLDGETRRLLMERYFRKGKLVAIFPEGTSATLFEGYRVGPFFPGVSRLAETSGAPIVPTAIVGAVEAVPLLGYAGADATGARDPPLALPLVLPSKIRIKFGRPISVEPGPRGKEEHYRVAARVREEVVEIVNSLRKPERKGRNTVVHQT